MQPGDLSGYTQCHFFAGLGGWAYAARLAEWPDDKELWTGSPPCQPFSKAGRGQNDRDPRHLWPWLHRLVAERRPDVVMGEQVASAIGRGWLDGVRLDLAESDYASGAVVLPACAIDAPHRRERLWFVAHPCEQGLQVSELSGEPSSPEQSIEARPATPELRPAYFWSDASWLRGHDGKRRRVGPGVRLLADGIPTRVPKLRALGNAIVPQVAAEVIRAYMEAQ